MTCFLKEVIDVPLFTLSGISFPNFRGTKGKTMVKSGKEEKSSFDSHGDYAWCCSSCLDPSYTSKDGLPDHARFLNMENVK